MFIVDPYFNLILYSIYGPIVAGQIYTDALPSKGMFIRNKMSMVKWHLSVSVLKASRPSAVLALLCLALLSDLGPSIKYVCIRGRGVYQNYLIFGTMKGYEGKNLETFLKVRVANGC